MYRTWFVVPLVLVVSLVWSASRYEAPDRVLQRALRVFLQIIGFMAVVLVVLAVLSYGL